MAFQQGLSGLAASSKSLDVISNNVSNATNVGFKSAGTQFADVYAASLSGVTGGVQVGIGTQVGRVQQAFNQGNITGTSNPLDIAINGDGFFEMESPDGKQVAYTRNGQFELDKDGYVVNAAGYKLHGYTEASPSTAVPLNTNVASALMGSPNPTDAVNLGLNLNSKALPLTFAAATPTVAELTNANAFSTSSTVYDSKGGSHVVTLYFARTTPVANPQPWNIYPSFDGANPTASIGTLTFGPDGRLQSPSPATIDLTVALPAGATYTMGPNVPNPPTTPAANTIRYDFTGSTEYGSKFNVTNLTQNGYQEGQMSGITISKEGVVEARYSNGQKSTLGTIALTTFPNKNGLASLGNNFWGSTFESGDPLTDRPGVGKRGLLQASAVEESNVDLTSELVNMITAQRNYQANAQSIKTQDSVMQTLVNLR